MRDDMHRLLVLRARGRADRRRPRHRYGKLRNADPETLPKREGINHHPFDRDRGSIDYLTPLRRFLRRQVGRRWDDIYSELCEAIDRRSVHRYHLVGHARGEVMIHGVQLRDGKPFYLSSWRGLRPIYRGELYVDPRDGVLKEGWGARG